MKNELIQEIGPSWASSRYSLVYTRINVYIRYNHKADSPWSQSNKSSNSVFLQVSLRMHVLKLAPGTLVTL